MTDYTQTLRVAPYVLLLVPSLAAAGTAAQRPKGSRSETIAKGLFVSLLVPAMMTFSSGWTAWPTWTPLVLEGAVIAGAVFSVWRARNNPLWPTDLKGRVTLIGYALGIVAFACASVVPALLPMPPRTLPLSFPVQTPRAQVANGGNLLALNPHQAVKAQRFALDIVALAENGQRGNAVFPSDLEGYEIFGAGVTAPCTGQVLAQRNSEQDQPPGLTGETILGNFVLLFCELPCIESQNGAQAGEHDACGPATIALAHLQQGSVRVKAGDQVRTGQQLARVGNSGNTSEPHLHIHAVAGRTLSLSEVVATGTPVPLSFDGQFLSRGDQIETGSGHGQR